MGPKMQKKLDELEEEFREARANGETGTAIRLLTQINNLRNLDEDSPDEAPEE